MKNQKINEDDQPVSRKCMRKLAEIAGPLIALMIVAQITTTFFIIRYLPSTTANITASSLSILTDAPKTEMQDRTKAQLENERNDIREYPEEEIVEVTPVKTTEYVYVYVEPEPTPEPVVVEPIPEPVVEEPAVIEEANVHETDSDSEEDADDTENSQASTSTGLFTVEDDSCPTGYALMDARLNKTCE